MIAALTQLYLRLTLVRWPLAILLAAAVLGVSAYFAGSFKLDASSDSLVLEGDKDLAFYREVRAEYGSDDFLVVTYSPSADLFDQATLTHLGRLRDEIAALPFVKSVTSILDVPLLDSPRVTLAEVQENQRTLRDPDTDTDLARREFQTSPLYRDLVMNRDGTITAMLVVLEPQEQARSLLDRRQALRELRDRQGLDAAAQAELEQVSTAYDAEKARAQAELQTRIDAVRGVLERYRDEAEIFLGGAPMIAADMIDFVRADLRTFGIGVGLFILVLLAVSFGQPRWVAAPTAICAAVTLVTVGFLGWMDWRVTIVSSNFISLLLIITLSLAIHLIVRHRELHTADPSRSQHELLSETVQSKFKPSLFTAATTMVSFLSLAVSGIRPVIDFGLMMTWGCLFAFVLTFLLFPSLLAFLKPGTPPTERRDVTARVTRGFARLVTQTPRPTAIAFVVLVIGGSVGIARLTVENRFIDYFKSDTEIYQGMVVIDRELGGTTPLDIVLDPPQWFFDEQAEDAEYAAEEDFAMSRSGGLSAESYWFNSRQIAQLQEIDEYLRSLPETGKILSLGTSMQVAQMVNNDEPLGDFFLAVMHRMLPETLKKELLGPYMREDGNQVRISVRVIDSYPNLLRDDLLEKIRHDLVHKFDLEPQQVHLSGLLVLYNNVIQSLFQSQASTLGVVFAAISLMFLLLFGSPKMALVGVAPTLVAAGMILGIMGWLGIPLDVMTITIAAITIGIGVHDTIHYTHRYKEEVSSDGDYRAAVLRTHASVGRAMFYTTVVVTLGFSILVLSNFIPTIYFGLFTGIAMILALAANLTLLPLLLMALKPFGRGDDAQAEK